MTALPITQSLLARLRNRLSSRPRSWLFSLLAVIMLASVTLEIPETITGLIGAALIAISLMWSIRYNRRHRSEPDEAPLD